MLIKIIKGTYGLHVNGCVVGKDVNSQPFEVDDVTAAELIELGVAEEAVIKVATVNPPISDKGAGENLVNKETETSGKNNVILEGTEIPGYSMDMTAAELRALAEKFEVKIEPRATKAEIIAALDEVFKKIPEDDLILNTEDPVI
ncbi:MAG: hypothetical protein ACI4RU_07935 [Acutalibacteraceae bacterium]